MRHALALVPLFLAVAGCSGGPDQEQRSGGGGTESPAPSATNASEEVAMEAGGSASEQRAAAGPNISITAAPGVAFNYRYAFRLGHERIAEVQEQHAARCESLGVERCRIVGWVYRRQGDEDIEARIDFKLDPSIARAFGREGVGAVVRADGMLIESEITGTDVAPTIRRAGQGIAQMRQDLARLEARLAGRLSSGERADLEYQAQQLRDSIRAAEQNREDVQATLATTPMTFVYGSGRFVPGPQPRASVAKTMRDAWENFLDGASILFVLVVTLLPWMLLGLLVWLAVRWVRRRFVGHPAPAAEAPGAEPPPAA